VEELRACTTCNACVEACPVSISPLDIILKQRRYLILDESNSPGEWNAMFGNIENNFAPWKFSADEREAWTEQA
jgi:Fe-S oxidoreductase